MLFYYNVDNIRERTACCFIRLLTTYVSVRHAVLLLLRSGAFPDPYEALLARVQDEDILRRNISIVIINMIIIWIERLSLFYNFASV